MPATGFDERSPTDSIRDFSPTSREIPQPITMSDEIKMRGRVRFAPEPEVQRRAFEDQAWGGHCLDPGRELILDTRHLSLDFSDARYYFYFIGSQFLFFPLNTT